MSFKQIAADSKACRRKVVRVTRSPMNKIRWIVDLECGHEMWLQLERKPAHKMLLCPTCFEELP